MVLDFVGAKDGAESETIYEKKKVICLGRNACNDGMWNFRLWCEGRNCHRS